MNEPDSKYARPYYDNKDDNSYRSLFRTRSAKVCM